MPKNIFTLKDAAVRLGVTRKFLLAAIESEVIKPLEIGRRRLITEAEIKRFQSSVAA
jgi:excisionase family DNA binding protein